MDIEGLKLLFSHKDIEDTLQGLADKLNDEFKNKRPIIISILKGSFIFCADLVRKLKFPVEIDFIRAASYGRNAVSYGEVTILKDIELPIKGRDVIIVEDIVDTGITLKYIYKHLKAKGPSSLKICALVDKIERRKVEILIDFVGFKVERGFLVGYGLDFDEKFRYLPEIYRLTL